MKKGASHVDWAISMGIFLVVIMLTLMFLRPGMEPISSGEVLLGLVEEGLNNNASFSLNKGFLVITLKDGIASGSYRVRIRNPIQNGLNPAWKSDMTHLGLVNNSLGKIPSEELLYTAYDLDDEYCAIDPDTCLTDVLDIETYLFSNEKNILWLLYSEDINPPPQNVQIDSLSDSEIGCFKEGNCLLDTADFTYNFGVVETNAGFSISELEKLDSISDDDYKKLKDNWGLPEDKNFKITIEQI